MPRVSIPERFRVLGEIASSEAELLFRARDRVLQREVFLKCPGPGLGRVFRDRDLRDTMLSEARALARVNHPYVIRLLEVLDTTEGPILVIEPTMGETLADRLSREGRLGPGEVLNLARTLSEALEAIHAAGVIHRGLNSECVVLRSDGTPCLTGFHYSKREAAAGMTAMTSIAYRDPKTGTDGVRVDSAPPHPAPEQLLGQPADERSDLFSLAWMLFECLTGRPPFDDPNPFAWTTPADPAKLVPGTPSALTRSIVRCLSKDPSKRPESAQALLRALATKPTEVERDRPAASSSWSRGWLFGAAAVVTIALRDLPRSSDRYRGGRGFGLPSLEQCRDRCYGDCRRAESVGT
jgi:serine/threonine-protein kinase